MGTATGSKFNLQAAVAAYQTLANNAPAAIKPQIEIVASAFVTFATALQKAGYKVGSVPSATQIASLESAAKALETPQLQSAEKAIAAWASTNCKA
jgi:hypothetical protein